MARGSTASYCWPGKVIETENDMPGLIACLSLGIRASICKVRLVESTRLSTASTVPAKLSPGRATAAAVTGWPTFTSEA